MNDLFLDGTGVGIQAGPSLGVRARLLIARGRLHEDWECLGWSDLGFGTIKEVHRPLSFLQIREPLLRVELAWPLS